MADIDEIPTASGELTLQTVAMPKDANAHGDIFGGWLLSHMDLAGATAAQAVAKGKVTTVAVGNMVFLRPVPVGSVVGCYCEVLETGRSSIKVRVEVWVTPTDGDISEDAQHKVTDGDFVYVAIDNAGRTRPLS